MYDDIKSLKKQTITEFFKWLREPFSSFFKAGSLEQLWIPFFIFISIIPVFLPNKAENSTHLLLHNLLWVYFLAYLSSKMPYVFQSFKNLYGILNLDKFSELSDAKKFQTQDLYQKKLQHLCCLEMRTLYAILFFVLSIYYLSASPTTSWETFIIAILTLFFLLRTILYTLKTFNPVEKNAAEEMEKQVETAQSTKRMVKIL